MTQQGQESKLNHWIYLFTVGIILTAIACSCAKVPAVPPATYTSPTEQINVMKLPEPKYNSNISIEESLLRRRSVRSYTGQPLTLQEVSQLLWAAQGITDPGGFRTAPSAGALYPLELYVVVGDVQDLPPAVYRYRPDGHQLVKTMDGDGRDALASAALGQECVKKGAVAFIFTGVYERTTSKYGDRGMTYVHIEVGHSAQNLCLQATAMDLGAVTIGAFNDDQVSKFLNLPGKEWPLYIIPVGRK